MTAPCTHGDSCQRSQLLATEVEVLKSNMSWMKDTVDAIRRSTEEIAGYAKQIVRLETESEETRKALERSFDAIKDEEEARKEADINLAHALDKCGEMICQRLERIEKEMPSLQLVRTIVFGVVAAISTNAVAMVWVVAKLIVILQKVG